MLEALKAKLRGRHNSLRYKYMILPRDYLIEFLWFRIRGKRWIDFYAYRMNRETRKASVRGHLLLSDKYVDDAKYQLGYLVENGMCAGHKLLDFGCGPMRLRFWMEGTGVEYHGVDIARGRIEKGLCTLAARGIDIDPSRFVVVSDFNLTALTETNFDFIWANSVYTHMPVDEMIDSMKGLKRRLATGGKFIFTFSPSSEPHVVRMNQKDWRQPPSVIEDCAKQAGFDVRIAGRWTHLEDSMAAILTIPETQETSNAWPLPRTSR